MDEPLGVTSSTLTTASPAWLFGPGPRPKLRRMLLLLLLPTLALIGTLGFGFVFDDRLVIFQDPLVTGSLDLPTILGSQVRVVDITLGYFRPLITLTYRLDWLLWGANPGGFHLSNLLYHLLTTLLVYHVTFSATRDVAIAWLASVSFGVLPVHTEAVGWIQGRVDLVSAMLALLTLQALLAARNTSGRAAGGWSALSGVSFLAALMAKESAAALPLAWLVFEVSGPSSRARVCKISLARRGAPLAVAGCIYGLLRWRALSGAGGFPLGLAPMGPRVLGLLRALGEYGRVLVVPETTLNFHRVLWAPASFKTAAIAIAVPVILGSIVWATWRWVPLMFPWATWVPIMLIPPLLFVFYRRATTVGYYTAERFQYLPSVGWCVLLAWLLVCLLKSQERWARRSGPFIAFGVLAGYAGLLMVRLVPWADAVDLYQAMLAQPDLSPAIRDFAHNDLAQVYIERREFQAARREIQIALQRRPDYALTYNNMGVLLIQEGRPAEARPWLERAIQLSPSDSTAYGNLGIAFEAVGDAADARRVYEAGLRIDPTSAWLLRRWSSLSGGRPPATGRAGGSP